MRCQIHSSWNCGYHHCQTYYAGMGYSVPGDIEIGLNGDLAVDIGGGLAIDLATGDLEVETPFGLVDIEQGW